jgi:membrane-associated phospholipid phosphatase
MPVQLKAPPSRRRARTVPPRPHPVGDKKVVALRLIGGVVGLWGLLSLIGLLVTHVLNTGPVHSADRGVDVWFAAHRTAPWNDITFVGTSMATTDTAIAVTVVVVLFLRWRLGRWYESLILITAMAGELLIFLAVTQTVHRPRPPVARLDVAPPTSSFPSGHTAAGTVLYVGIMILMLWIYGRRPATRVAAVVLCCIPFIVGLSRLYRGMHYPSDVLAGALLGGLWLLVVITTLLPRQQRAAREQRAPRQQRAPRKQRGTRRDRNAPAPR